MGAKNFGLETKQRKEVEFERFNRFDKNYCEFACDSSQTVIRIHLMNVSVRNLPLAILVVAGLLAAQDARSQTTTVSTSPVGYVQLACTGSSDSLYTIPFTQPAAYVGLVASVSGSTVTVSGTAGWTANQFVYSGSGSSTYFALLGAATTGTNPREGATYTVTANGTNTLTLSLNGDTISSSTNCTISVIPYWTLATVFPSSNELSVNPNGSFSKSTSTRLTNLNTQILIPSYSGTGINLSAASIYYYYNGAWRLYGDSSSNYHGDDVLVNNGYFVVRNSNTPTTSLTAMGTVVTGKVLVPLATEAAISQDNPVALVRPVDVPLNSTGLAGTSAFTTSTSTRLTNLSDQLLLYSDTTSGINKSAASIYYYYNGHWALYGDSSSNDHGTDVIPAGNGFVIRKVANGTGATAFWQDSPTY